MVVGVEGPLDRLDALVEGRLGVAGEDRDRGLGQHWAGIHLQGGEVHGGAGLGHAGGQGVVAPHATRGRPGGAPGGC